MSQELEEGNELKLDFQKLRKAAGSGADVLPVVVQDADSLEVLIVAYINEAALQYSFEHRIAAFWSTSRGELWIKGATSGDFLDLVEVRVNCEQNSLLFLVRPRAGGVCHTRDEHGKTRPSCYYRTVTGLKGNDVLEFR